MGKPLLYAGLYDCLGVDSFGARHEIFVTVRILDRPPPPGQPSGPARVDGEVSMNAAMLIFFSLRMDP